MVRITGQKLPRSNISITCFACVTLEYTQDSEDIAFLGEKKSLTCVARG